MATRKTRKTAAPRAGEKAAKRKRRRKRAGLAGSGSPPSPSETDKIKAEWINRLAWVGGGIGAAVLGVWGAKQIWKGTVGEIQQQNATAQTTVDGRPEFFANELSIAFHPSGNQSMSDWFGDGTDEEKVLVLLQQIPSRRVWEQTLAAYRKLTKGRDLTEDLEDELTSAFGNEDWDAARKIIGSKK